MLLFVTARDLNLVVIRGETRARNRQRRESLYVSIIIVFEMRLLQLAIIAQLINSRDHRTSCNNIAGLHT